MTVFTLKSRLTRVNSDVLKGPNHAKWMRNRYCWGLETRKSFAIAYTTFSWYTKQMMGEINQKRLNKQTERDRGREGKKN